MGGLCGLCSDIVLLSVIPRHIPRAAHSEHPGRTEWKSDLYEGATGWRSAYALEKNVGSNDCTGGGIAGALK
jgi:hypothetical protein